MTTSRDPLTIDEIMAEAHKTAVSKGFWDDDRDDRIGIALMHSELSEALEALREGNPESPNLPGFPHVVEEYADCIIRIADTCKARGLDLSGAVAAKLEFNRGRPFMHRKTC